MEFAQCTMGDQFLLRDVLWNNNSWDWNKNSSNGGFFFLVITTLEGLHARIKRRCSLLVYGCVEAVYYCNTATANSVISGMMIAFD